jgi:hypothetical protein
MNIDSYLQVPPFHTLPPLFLLLSLFCCSHLVSVICPACHDAGRRQRIHGGLSRFEELVHKIADILDNRIEGNLKAISKTLLVELPSDQSFTLEQFVMLQEKTTKVLCHAAPSVHGRPAGASNEHVVRCPHPAK